MNWVEIQANWNGLCPLLKTQWPKLRDEDLARIGGSREELARTLERLYGLGPEDALREICEFEKDVRFPGAVK